MNYSTHCVRPMIEDITPMIYSLLTAEISDVTGDLVTECKGRQM